MIITETGIQNLCLPSEFRRIKCSAIPSLFCVYAYILFHNTLTDKCKWMQVSQFSFRLSDALQYLDLHVRVTDMQI